MNKPVTLLFLMFCIHVCIVNAEHSVEDWLDLASDARLFKSIKSGEYSPKKTCLPLFLPNQIFWESIPRDPYTVSVPMPDFLSDWVINNSLYKLIASEECDSVFALNMLKLMAKIIVEHGSEMKNYDLHPKKIRISTTNDSLKMTFVGDITPFPQTPDEQESMIMNTADDPRCAFAYLMFYLVYPDSQKGIDCGLIRIIKEHFCTFEPKIDFFTPIYPFLVEYPNHLTDNCETFYSFEACAIQLFYGEITMKDVVAYFENWMDFTRLCNMLLTSIESKLQDWRNSTRYVLRIQNFSKTLLDLAKKIVPLLYGKANLLYWIEEGIPVWECEEKFKEELFPREKFVDERFASAVNALCKKAGISKGESSAPEPEIIISERTHIKLSTLYEKVNAIE